MVWWAICQRTGLLHVCIKPIWCDFFPPLSCPMRLHLLLWHYSKSFLPFCSGQSHLILRIMSCNSFPHNWVMQMLKPHLWQQAQCVALWFLTSKKLGALNRQKYILPNSGKYKLKLVAKKQSKAGHDHSVIMQLELALELVQYFRTLCYTYC